MSKEPAIHLFHKERNPVTRFHIFCPLKMKQKNPDFLSVGSFLYLSEADPTLTHTHSQKVTALAK